MLAAWFAVWESHMLLVGLCIAVGCVGIAVVFAIALARISAEADRDIERQTRKRDHVGRS